MKHPIFTVTKFEIKRQIKKPSFWLSLFLVPAFIFGLGFLSVFDRSQLEQIGEKSTSTEQSIYGLTAPRQLINPENLAQLKNIPKFNFFETKEQGIQAVKSGKIQTYYFLAEDFLKKPAISVYAKNKDGELFNNHQAALEQILTQLALNQTPEFSAIILTNKHSYQTTNFDQSGQEVNLLGRAIIPGAVLACFYILIVVFGNRMLMVVVEEKENRISEMLLTAISAKDLIVGKIIALITLGLIQILIFLMPIISLIIINRTNPALSGLIASIEFQAGPFFANLALLFCSYFLFAGFSTLVGSLVSTARDASQYISVVMIGIISPLFFISSFISSEVNFIANFLSYFPLSAPIALMLRNTVGTISAPELFLGILEITLSSIIVIYLAIKNFQKNAINFSVSKFNFKLNLKPKIWKA